MRNEYVNGKFYRVSLIVAIYIIWTFASKSFTANIVEIVQQSGLTSD